MSFENYTENEAKAISALYDFFTQNCFETIKEICKASDVKCKEGIWIDNLKTVFLYCSLPDGYLPWTPPQIYFNLNNIRYSIRFDDLEKIIQNFVRVNKIKVFL